MKLKTCFFLALALASSLSADDMVGRPTKKEVISAIPHVWLAGDILYLRAHEQKNGFATASKPIGFLSTYTQTGVTNPCYAWNPGMRLEFGYQPKELAWFGRWTHLHNYAKGHKSTDGTRGFFPVASLYNTLSPFSYVTSANMQWRLNMHLIDIGVTYPWMRKEWFTLKPHLAVRSAILNQNKQVLYGGGFFNEGIDTVKQKSDFWGIGFDVGLTPALSFGQGFSLVGDVSVSGLLGHQFNQQKESYLGSSLYSHAQEGTRFRWIASARAAVNWEKELMYKAIILNAQIGWEWNTFFNQNKLPHNHLVAEHGNRNLSVQGGYVSLGIGF